VNSQADGDILFSRDGSVRIYYSEEEKYLPLCWQEEWDEQQEKNVANTVCRQFGFAKAQKYVCIDVRSVT